MSSEPFAGTYPDDADFWVPHADASDYPPRYGDLFRTPPHLTDTKGRPWTLVMVLHPSCEMGAKGAPAGAQVVRVHLLREVGRGQRDDVRVGYREREFGVAAVRINMVYLAPPPPGPDPAVPAEELFADLRKSARVPLDDLLSAGRVAAMTHDARLALLRRDILFRYRWDLPISEIMRLEQGRIGADPDFAGPKPSWAVPPSSEVHPGS